MMTFHTQRVPILHNFDEPCYPKNKKYLKKLDDEFHIQRVITLHTFDGPCCLRNKKYLKNMMMTSSSLPQKQEIPKKSDDDIIITLF